MINAGSRDEGKKEQGLAHLIEHTLFKGTQKRKTYHILNRLDSVGGELNASTTKEETAIYASFLGEYFERAIELICDIAFHSTFPEKEIKKEKDVIIDEINSYLDSPGELIFDEFEEQIFKGHSIGRNILGTHRSVTNLSQKAIKDFVKRRYATNQIVFSFAGNVPPKKFRKLVEKYLIRYPKKTNLNGRKQFNRYQPRNEIIDRNLHQAHYILGNLGFDAMHKRRHELILLNNYLGGPALNSLLSLKIREKYGIAYYLESSYTSYSDTGLFSIYMGTDEAQVQKGASLIKKELKLLRTKKLGTAQLNSAKKQIIGQIALSRDNGLNLCLSAAKSMLVYNKLSTTKEVIKKIEEIDSKRLLETANIIFKKDKLSSLTFI